MPESVEDLEMKIARLQTKVHGHSIQTSQDDSLNPGTEQTVPHMQGLGILLESFQNQNKVQGSLNYTICESNS